MELRVVQGRRPVPNTVWPFDSVLDRNCRRQLESLVSVVDLAPGDVVAREGEVNGDFLLVSSGLLKLAKRLPDGRQQIVAFRSVGDILTLHRRDTPWPVTAQSVRASKLCRIEWEGLRRMADANPEIDRALLDLAADEITGLQERMVTLGRKSTEEKVASFLLEFCQPLAVQSNICREFALPMRRPEIADYLGLTTESVCRELSRLKREKIVAMPRPSRVVVLNRPALEALAHGETNRATYSSGSGMQARRERERARVGPR
ncbi:MAG: helix-turn-helix domain-containing protein [Alphaproteobacteria bacterium]|nr:helix-turn-helix domain-containing protein [Alphaproteobacteria bacterium]